MRVFLCFLFSLIFLYNASSQTITPASPVTLCPGGTKTLTLNGAPAGASFQWLQGVIPTIINIPGATQSTYDVTATGTYSVIVTSAGIPDTIGPVIVTLAPVPNASFTVSPHSIQCGNIAYVFSSTSTGTGLTYSWNFGYPLTTTHT